MIVYGDTSALVKLFVVEDGSQATRAMVGQAQVLGTGLLTRAELGAALARGMRRGILGKAEGHTARRQVEAVWPTWVHVAVDENLVQWAERLAWQYGLRGYDAVHLASALVWQEHIGYPVTIASFDQELWQASHRAGLSTWPEQIPER